ncbi:MAG: hypothetical protein ABDI20_07220, partial [Candidatus Bipolaricaulaceae bacterium]
MQQLLVLFFFSLGVVGLVVSGQVLFMQNFEGPTPAPPQLPAGWTTTQTPSLTVVGWKVVDKAHLWGESAQILAFPSGTRALYFGRVDPTTGKGSYEEGPKAVSGTVITPAISLSNAKYIRISFYYLRIVEEYTGGHYDETIVEYSWDGDTWNSLWWKSSKDPKDSTWKKWVSEPIEVSQKVSTMRLRFIFNSKDGQSNNFLGWLIDDLVVERVPPPLTVELRQGGSPQVSVTSVVATVGQSLPDY